jgi:hypothetical protein
VAEPGEVWIEFCLHQMSELQELRHYIWKEKKSQHCHTNTFSQYFYSDQAVTAVQVFVVVSTAFKSNI